MTSSTMVPLNLMMQSTSAAYGGYSQSPAKNNNYMPVISQ